MKTISRIAYSNDKKNKTRSILIMMAICLATMLLVIISTVGNGVIHLQKSQAAGSYRIPLTTNSSGLYSDCIPAR